MTVQPPEQPLWSALSRDPSIPCPRGPHRIPQGPNEDIAQCPVCLAPDYVLRPPGETFGEHLPDCSLPERHEGRCVGGGNGHPRAPLVRGYFPPEQPLPRDLPCQHPALITITGRPGWLECVTCGQTLPDPEERP